MFHHCQTGTRLQRPGLPSSPPLQPPPPPKPHPPPHTPAHTHTHRQPLTPSHPRPTHQSTHPHLLRGRGEGPPGPVLRGAKQVPQHTEDSVGLSGGGVEGLFIPLSPPPPLPSLFQFNIIVDDGRETAGTAASWPLRRRGALPSLVARARTTPPPCSHPAAAGAPHPPPTSTHTQTNSNTIVVPSHLQPLAPQKRQYDSCPVPPAATRGSPPGKRPPRRRQRRCRAAGGRISRAQWPAWPPPSPRSPPICTHVCVLGGGAGCGTKGQACDAWMPGGGRARGRGAPLAPVRHGHTEWDTSSGSSSSSSIPSFLHQKGPHFRSSSRLAAAMRAAMSGSLAPAEGRGRAAVCVSLGGGGGGWQQCAAHFC